VDIPPVHQAAECHTLCIISSPVLSDPARARLVAVYTLLANLGRQARQQQAQGGEIGGQNEHVAVQHDTGGK
jgi:hypothetical protein